MRFIIVLFLFSCSPKGNNSHLSTSANELVSSRPPVEMSEGVLQAEITGSDDLDRRGRLSDSYAIRLSEGERVRLWALSPSLDTMIEVHGPDGMRLRCDDFVPGNLNPLVEFEAPEDNEYLVRIMGYGPGAQGPYQFGFVRLHPENGPILQAGTDTMQNIGPGAAGQGIITGARFWIQAQSGERIRVRVNSAEFDTTAALISPDGRVWANDDAGDTGPDGSERPLDSTILVMAPVTGYYHLLIAPYGGVGNGAFRVRTESRPAVMLTDGRTVPEMGYAGRRSEGRVLGLFAGITNYQEGRGRLYGCADDASLLAQAFRERNLQSDQEQIVLTDINANIAAFTAGIQRLATMATPQDVVIIFFSGHGGSVALEAPDPFELDGTDETIILYDGPMRDHHVVQMIDQINADVIILALDSCHSGGFARDFVTRPGRIGLFSSDEDVLSDTAEPYRAGGYLSYALRRAVIGEADSMPRDGAVFAGELTDYLHGSFVQTNRHMNPEDSYSPRQWLVSRRGSMGWSDLLWLYPRQSDGSLMPIPEVSLDSPVPGRR